MTVSVRCWAVQEGRMWLMAACLVRLGRSGGPAFRGALAAGKAPPGGGGRRGRRDRAVRKIHNDASEILTALGELLDLADVSMGPLTSGPASVLRWALRAAHGPEPGYVPGRTVNRMSGAYRSEADADARGAYVIAEATCHRRDFGTVDVPAPLIADLSLPTAHRTGPAAERVRLVDWLRDVLTGVFLAPMQAVPVSVVAGACGPSAFSASPGVALAEAIQPGRKRFSPSPRTRTGTLFWRSSLRIAVPSEWVDRGGGKAAARPVRVRGQCRSGVTGTITELAVTYLEGGMRLLGSKCESSSAAWAVGRLVRRALRVCGGPRRAGHRAAVVRPPLVLPARAPGAGGFGYGAVLGPLGKQSEAK
ncbi:transposase [Streptomyces sp. NPDC002935]|uniref:IS110 family transposase n=1 Tax=Streptomyces sp. NPDC002935 TaxID=3154545 RepID=UPI0033A946EC